MLNPEPHRVEIALMRTARAVRQAFNARLAPIGLTMTEGALLSFVEDNESISQRGLAELLHISRVSVGTLIDGLAERGLVRRLANPNDRRVWLIELTPTGTDLVAQFRVIDEQLRTSLRAGFDRAERHLLADFLQRLEGNAVAAATHTHTVDRST